MNYLKIAFRNIIKNLGYSVIYIVGLAVGIGITTIDALWIHDELTYNQTYKNHKRIAQVMHHDTFNGERMTMIWNPHLFGDMLRKNYDKDFKYVVMATYPDLHILKYGEKTLNMEGNYMDKEAPLMLSLEANRGVVDGLQDPYSIMLSESTAKAIFGKEDPINKIIRLDKAADVKVTGVYKDLPYNSDFRNLAFIAPWQLLLTTNPFIKADPDPWGSNNYQTYVQIADNANMENLSARIKNIKLDALDKERAKQYQSEVFLHPMNKWHLYSEFKNGINTGGRIEFIWLFGIIGAFVLFLACINFMNLSTARSQNRAKEIGIRKTIGSSRWQLIIQFFTESLLITLFAFLLAIILILASISFFNQVADKHLAILWGNPWFWLFCILFCFITAIIAGLYPSLYLSALQPVKILKGIFKSGRFAIFQRKILVVFQFTISVILIISTIVVFRQIEYAKNRQIGYNPKDLIVVANSQDIHDHLKALTTELKASGAVQEIVESANSTTGNTVSDGRFDWEGKDPNLSLDIPISNVSPAYGKTIGWKIKQGRDFSTDMLSDSSAFILNEAAVRFTGLKDPVGKIVHWKGMPFHIIGVINDIVIESPYQPAKPYIYQMTGDQSYFVTVKLNSSIGMVNALEKTRQIFAKYDPQLPFDYKFV
ncbi:MAG: ABC transporter permease, partial [Chitinophagaceae bacterium]